MRQVSKQGSIVAQVEGQDEAPTTIKRKEAPLRKGIENWKGEGKV